MSYPDSETGSQHSASTANGGFRIQVKAFRATYQIREMTKDDLDRMYDHFTSDEFYVGESEVTCSLELTKTGETHAHMYYYRKDRPIDCLKSHFAWMGHDNPNISNNTQRCSKDSIKQGHFYQVNRWKTDTVHTRTNTEITTVPYKWIKNMAIEGKMKYEDIPACASHYYAWGAVAKRDWETQKDEMKNQGLHERVEKRRKLLDAKRKTFKHYEQIIAWAQQYEEDLDRYDFLVIWGEKTKTGKSQLARSMFKNPFLHCNVINWKKDGGYDYDIHDGVVFNDVPNIYQYILDNKEMFTANCDIHTVHTSAASGGNNWNARDIWLAGTPIIITSNYDPIIKDVKSDYHGNTTTIFHDTWIKNNAYILEVTEQTWWDNPRPNYYNFKLSPPSLIKNSPSIIDREFSQGSQGDCLQEQTTTKI